MERVSHDGRATAYRQPDRGTGPTTLFVHGSGGTHEVWTRQYGRSSPPYQPVAVDLSGHGDSDDLGAGPEVDSHGIEAGPETLRAYAIDVRAVARATGATVLVGNSLGGAVVQRLCLDFDVELDGIVLLGTGAKLTVHADLRDLLAEEFERAIDVLHGEDMLFHDPEPKFVEQSRAAMREVGRRVTERDFLSCHSFDVRDRVDEIAVPALALVGEHDSLTPVTYHEFFASELPDCDCQTIPDAAHLAMIERPAAVNDAIDQFVASL